jgi:DNA repair protein RecO (recombination protein O)
MADYLTDDAICLRVTDFSETSQIVALFTAHHGILGVIAKGAKRQSKKGASGSMSGPLDLLTAGEVVFIPAKGTAELGTLAGWELLDPRGGLRTNLPALNAAYLCAEVTLGLLHAHDPHDDLFVQLEATLQQLPTPQRPRVLLAYLKAALTAAGYQPHLDACVECGKRTNPDETWRFSPRAGGIVCATCPSAGTTLPLPGRIAIALDRLESPTQLATATPPRQADPAALQLATNVLLTQIETLLDRKLKTRDLIK